MKDQSMIIALHIDENRLNDKYMYIYIYMKKKMYILCQSYAVTAAYHSCGKKSAMPKGSLQKKR